jgi:pterin-4a-carbinolamine dehydratase
MNLKTLHREFIELADRPMEFNRLPVSPRDIKHPVVPVDRWEKTDEGALKKRFKFRKSAQRDHFVFELVKYEKSTGHRAETILVSRDTVVLRLSTEDTGKASELDKEYSIYADALYKDIVYSVTDENNS